MFAVPVTSIWSFAVGLNSIVVVELEAKIISPPTFKVPMLFPGFNAPPLVTSSNEEIVPAPTRVPPLLTVTWPVISRPPGFVIDPVNCKSPTAANSLPPASIPLLNAIVFPLPVVKVRSPPLRVTAPV